MPSVVAPFDVPALGTSPGTLGALGSGAGDSDDRGDAGGVVLSLEQPATASASAAAPRG
jgi:hypothetical protein